MSTAFGRSIAKIEILSGDDHRRPKEEISRRLRHHRFLPGVEGLDVCVIPAMAEHAFAWIAQLHVARLRARHPYQRVLSGRQRGPRRLCCFWRLSGLLGWLLRTRCLRIGPGRCGEGSDAQEQTNPIIRRKRLASSRVDDMPPAPQSAVEFVPHDTTCIVRVPRHLSTGVFTQTPSSPVFPREGERIARFATRGNPSCAGTTEKRHIDLVRHDPQRRVLSRHKRLRPTLGRPAACLIG